MGRYRRTVSFPNPSPISHGLSTKPETKSLHVRSASLPCTRSNPLIPQLQDELNQLRSISLKQTGLSSVCDTLNRLKGVLDSLDDVLQLPQTLDSLSSSTTFIENLLEEFLRFVDAYGILQASLLGLKHELAEAQVAIRRKDVSKLGLHVKAQKRITNDISKLVGSISVAEPRPKTIPSLNDNSGEAEIRGIICDVHGVMASVSVGLFGVIHASFELTRKPGWARFGPPRRGVERMLIGMKKKASDDKSESENEIIKKGMLLKRMQEMEDCVGEMEKRSGRVLRSLISSRVSLLNILTHASD